MRQLPALFSTPMVQAILENRKIMTRRTAGLEIINGHPDLYYLSGFNNETNSFVFKMTVNVMEIPDIHIESRYQVGDQLWVKETYYAYGYWIETGNLTKTDKTQYKFVDLTVKRGHKYLYETESEIPKKILNRNAVKDSLYGWFKRPSLYMPKAASRILIEVTKVRCERLQDITEADSIAEGVQEFGSLTNRYVDYCPENHYTKDELKSGYVFEPTAVYSFKTLWESINGIESVRLNPWLFVYSFKRIEKP